jgi:hypothetical protein
MKSYKELIPFVKYNQADELVSQYKIEECVICLDKFVEGEDLRILPTCQHIFHDHCLINWFSGLQQRESQKCPQCNQEVTVEALKNAVISPK